MNNVESSFGQESFDKYVKKAVVAGLVGASALSLSGCSREYSGDPAYRGQLMMDVNLKYPITGDEVGTFPYRYNYENTDGEDVSIVCSSMSPYRVQGGDTLTSIAEDVGLVYGNVDQTLPSTEAIVDVIAIANQIGDENHIQADDVIEVPIWCDTPRS